MLHDPRAKCPAPPALLAALKHCGIDFKQSVWLIEKQLQRDQDEPTLIQAYLRATEVEHKVHRHIGRDEASHLTTPAIVKTDQGHLIFIASHQRAENNLMWAIEIQPGGPPTNAAPSESTEPVGLWTFWKTLRTSTWFKKAIDFDWAAFKPILYA